MKQKDVLDLIKLIDRNYKTDLASDRDVLMDWYKILKNYDLSDITSSLDYYMKNYTNYAPKVYELIKGYKTIDDKKVLDGATTRCLFCNKIIDFDDIKHIDKCRSIEFIKVTVRRFKKQEIDTQKYLDMSEDEFNKYYLSAVKLVINNTNNKLEKAMWQKYLDNCE